MGPGFKQAEFPPLALLLAGWLQVCLVARKGSDPPGMRGGVGSDIIFR